MHKLVQGDGKRILSSADIASLEAQLHTLITIYAPDQLESTPHDVTEARRPPVKATKQPRWWEKF